MPPVAPLQYGRTSQHIVQRLCVFARPFRLVIAVGTLVAVVLYCVSYRSVRQSHTKFWFDKVTEQSGPYTLFDAYSHREFCLYVVFWPACAADRAITGRRFEYDKW